MSLNIKTNVNHNILLIGGWGIFVYVLGMVVAFIVNRGLFVNIAIYSLYGFMGTIALALLTAFLFAIVHIYHKAIKTSVAHVDENWLVTREGKPFRKELIVHTKQLPQNKIKELPPLSLPEPAKPVIDTFSELLTSGVVNQVLSQGKLIIGYSLEKDGSAVMRMGTWKELYSCAVAGVSGAGKTTTVLFLLYQAILCGTKLILVDPHMGDPEESLAARLVGFEKAFIHKPCDDNSIAVLKRVRWLKTELAHRKAHGIKEPRIIAVFDEINALMRNDEIKGELSELIVMIAEEGRKFGIFALLIGQRWAAQEIGNNASVRGALASTMVHRLTDTNQIKLLMGSTKHNEAVLSLTQGHYLFRDTNGGLSEMVTPYTDDKDGQYVQRLLTSRSTSQSLSKHFSVTSSPLTEVNQEVDSYIDAEPIEVTSEVNAFPDNSPLDESLVSRVSKLLFLERLSDTKIIEREWGCTGGTKFTMAKAELETIKHCIMSRIDRKGV